MAVRTQAAPQFLKVTFFEALTLNSVDSQFLELKQHQTLEIARVFRVPPIFIGEYGRATWANSEEQGKQLLTYTLMPWIKRWEGEIALKLFTPDERHRLGSLNS